jgi:hypothetical protein
MVGQSEVGLWIDGYGGLDGVLGGVAEIGGGGGVDTLLFELVWCLCSVARVDACCFALGS